MYMTAQIMNLINKYSKRMHIDIGYFLNASIWTIVIMFFEATFGLLLSYVIANYIDKVLVGKYFFTISTLSIFSVFTLSGFVIASTNDFIKNKYILYSYGTKFRVLGGILGSLGAITLAIISYLLNYNIYPFLLLIALILPLNNFSIYFRYLYSKNKFKQFTLLAVVKLIIYYGVTIIAIISQKLELIYIIALMYGIQIIYDLIFYFYYLRKIKTKIKNLKPTKKQIRNGINFTATSSIQQISSNIDKLILPVYFNLNFLAIYAIALTIPKTIIDLFNKFLFMLFYKKFVKFEWREIKIKLIFLTIGVISISVIISIMIPTLYEYIFPSYFESIVFAQALTFIIPIAFFNLILQKFCESKNESAKIFKINTLSQVTLFSSYVILIPLLGIWGAILSRFLKEIISIASYLFLIKK